MNKALRGQIKLNDYSLVGKNTQEAIEKGLAEAKWYASPVPKEKMRELLERRDGPALRDTALWFALIFATGLAGYLTWGTWWTIIPFALYGVLYASTSDSRWHECGHGTAFKTDWLNNVVYEIASFMVLRESTIWRWSHTRHHSDTIIIGRDPEIAVPRPTELHKFIWNFFNIGAVRKYIKEVSLHIRGKFTEEELTFLPEAERPAVIRRARIYVVIYLCVIGLAIYTGSILPLMFIGLPTLYGGWLMVVYGYTQHAGLAENVLDHRLNCRTVYMNRLNRYLYWNMNFHVEHHMFPLVPYHNLPKLHEIVKPDMPKPYASIVEAYKEIIPAILRQRTDPAWFVKRVLPTPTYPNEAPAQAKPLTAEGKPVLDGWIEVCPVGLLLKEDVVRFDHNNHTYAIYRTADNKYYATDGICTHGNAHLADGLVKGNLIECPKHNGRYDIRDGSPARMPVCVPLKTYDVRESKGHLELDLKSAKGMGVTAPAITYTFNVVSNNNVATFIKELVLELDPSSPHLAYKPGMYMQFDIPEYEQRTLANVEVKPPYAEVWKAQHVYEFETRNDMACRRNYSFATNPAKDKQLKFNIRIATPPRGQECPAGVGSSYMFGLKPGDKVTAIGPFGDFLIKPSEREMVYLGGGAGMAPLRAHLSHLLESQGSQRKISFWYGARSKQELFYQEYFEDLARKHPNFCFHLALSEPQPGDNWTGFTGFIHEVLQDEYLEKHPDPRSIDFYLCGPPPMMKAATAMLKELGVAPSQISFDEF
jgi:Na(+)-translocating NADH:ubiquinone oxidoreductase F subunit